MRRHRWQAVRTTMCLGETASDMNHLRQHRLVGPATGLAPLFLIDTLIFGRGCGEMVETLSSLDELPRRRPP